MATLGIGLSKVFILDKYFNELSKYWETEIKLQGMFDLFWKCEDFEVLLVTFEWNKLLSIKNIMWPTIWIRKKDHIAMSFESYNSIAGIQIIWSMICISKRRSEGLYGQTVNKYDHKRCDHKRLLRRLVASNNSNSMIFPLHFYHPIPYWMGMCSFFVNIRFWSNFIFTKSWTVRAEFSIRNTKTKWKSIVFKHLASHPNLAWLFLWHNSELHSFILYSGGKTD